MAERGSTEKEERSALARVDVVLSERPLLYPDWQADTRTISLVPRSANRRAAYRKTTKMPEKHCRRVMVVLVDSIGPKSSTVSKIIRFRPQVTHSELLYFVLLHTRICSKLSSVLFG